MKNHIKNTLTILLLLVIVSGCSMKKNTWSTRNYKAINTRFNVHFNGKVSYIDGLNNISKANKDDYSTIIPMYPISKHTNANAAASDMDRTIEKCRKAIKLYSIKQKPTKNLKKWNNPEYKLFYNQNEFNPALKNTWLLLAQAEFHKGDFLGSVGTFLYIGRYFSGDKEMNTKCQLWIVRAYAEMGWLYEAEQVLAKIEQNHLHKSDIGLFASVNADLLLKKHQYKEAIPFLELALNHENNKKNQQRFSYLLAQLYQKNGDTNAAYSLYSKVIKLNPSYEMDFNARINRAQLNVGNTDKVRNELRKMLKNTNNKEYLDQLYYALGNTYLVNADTANAIANYKLSSEKSTRNGLDKAITLIKLGDIYYFKKNYIDAQPCYDEASKIITNEHADYSRVTKRAETLGELVAENEIVVLQDSLLRLSKLSEKEQLDVIYKVIEKLEADEKAAADKVLKESLTPDFQQEDDMASMMPIGANPLGGIGEWYFYNPDLMRTGQNEFTKKWGKRKLEDNWRRTSKSTSLFEEAATNTPPINENADTATVKKETINDNKKPQFYLNQIPVTEAQKAKSNKDIANALFSMGVIYKDKVEDLPAAIKTFDEFAKRFANDQRIADAYFYNYLLNTRLENTTQANVYRSKLLIDFPNTKYYEILSQPDYNERLNRMYREQDSIYNLTYKAYNENNFDAVKKYVNYISKNYPLSTLMPKFLFLNALSVGKKDTSEKFETELSQLIKNYPQSDVSAMAKDILALMKQGREAKTGTTHGTLINRRDEIVKTENNITNPTQQFSEEINSRHRVLLISKMPIEKLNQLLYNTASYNFARFMIKDFDLAINKIDSTHNALSVNNFESYDEANWYANSIEKDENMAKLLADLNIEKVVVSETNFALLRSTFTMADYLTFARKLPKLKNTPKPNNTPKQNITTSATAIKTTEPKKKQLAATKQPTTAASGTQTTAETKTNKPANTKEPIKTTTPPVSVVAATTKTEKATPKEEVPLFKNLFAYKANEPHFVAIYVISGSIDFDKTKATLEAYNTQNYPTLKLKISLEKVDAQQIIIIGSMADAVTAKSYLLRMVKDRNLFLGLKGANYRNLLGTQQNLNTMMQQNAMDTYFEFMQEYYLK